MRTKSWKKLVFFYSNVENLVKSQSFSYRKSTFLPPFPSQKKSKESLTYHVHLLHKPTLIN